tara:strand:+ start:1130 stop:1441 length:312 start_codon:yes stop_codon:yes gene_type:complete
MVGMGARQCMNRRLTNVIEADGTFLANGATGCQNWLKHARLVDKVGQAMILKCLNSGLQDMATNRGSGHQSDVAVGIVDDQFEAPTFGVGQKWEQETVQTPRR